MLGNFVVGSATSSGLSDIVSFFNNQSSNGDVSGALGTAGFAFKIAMFVIMFIGAIAMAIWIGRIAVDILLITTRGTKIADNETLKKMGTVEGDKNYDSVMGYVKGNILEIVLVIVLITFLMTGWLFRLIAIALAGFGALGNKLFGLDIEGTLSSYEASNFAGQVEMRRLSSLKSQYDEELGNLRAESERLYDIAKKGAVSDDPKFLKAKKMYSMHMARADILGKSLESRSGVAEFKVDASYFKQHLKQAGNGVCNTKFLDTTILAQYTSGTGAAISISCDGA